MVQVGVGDEDVIDAQQFFELKVADPRARIDQDIGEDVFSRYLPWAISFDLADRWARICQDLVAAGRLPEVHPVWYVGPFYLPDFSWIGFTDAVATTVAPVPTVSIDSRVV